MANRSSVNPSLLAAAVNCLFVLSVFLNPRSALTEDNRSGRHHSGLSTGDDDVGGSSQVGNKDSVVGRDVASVLVEEDHYTRQRAAETAWRSYSYRRRSKGPSPTSRSSPQRERPTRGSSFKKAAPTALRIFLTSALISVAVLLSWQLGNVLVKCLTRARASSPTAGSSPRSLSESEGRVYDWDSYCEDMYSDTAANFRNYIPLVETPRDTHSDEDSEEETSMSGPGGGPDAERGSGAYVRFDNSARRRLTSKWKMILVVLIPVITCALVFLVWMLVTHFLSRVENTATVPPGGKPPTAAPRPGQSASLLSQLNAPVPSENATLSSQTGTSGPVSSRARRSTPSSSSPIPTARPSSETPLKSSPEDEPLSTPPTADSTYTFPAPSQPSSPSPGELSARRSRASSPASSPSTISTAPASAGSSSAAVGPSSAGEPGLSMPSANTSSSTSSAGTSSPSQETSSESPGETFSPSSEASFASPTGTSSSPDAAPDVLSPTSLSTEASTTAVHTTVSTPAPTPKWQTKRVWVNCNAEKVEGKATCYAKLYWFSWGSPYPHITYNDTAYQFDLKSWQVEKLKAQELYDPVLKELAEQIETRRRDLLETNPKEADGFRINLHSYQADLEHL